MEMIFRKTSTGVTAPQPADGPILFLAHEPNSTETTNSAEIIGEDDVAIPLEEIVQPDEEEGMDEKTVETTRALQGCDITQGRWVYDNVSYPLYRTKNCPFADPGFRCEDNGRPDKEFMSYHWQPHDCDLPR